jgi:hypothetical protein
VRVSNAAAQNLYKKYEFQVVDVKPRYYHNNGEDAYDMRLDLTQPGMAARFEARYAELMAKHRFTDRYSTGQPTRG